jgi:diguanylate cyclase (GGDEF)-like protein
MDGTASSADGQVDERLGVTATVGLDDRLLDAAAPLCALLGMSSAQLVGQRITDLTDPRDGTPLWQGLTLTLVRGADGAPSHYLAGLTSARERYEEELEWLATHDALTGLPNRRTFDSRFALELARTEREHVNLALAVLDIDEFKHFNDTFGHQVGDGVLARTGEVLCAQVRAHELMARVGGEEFAWILTGADAVGAHKAVERGRAAVSSTHYGEAGHVTLSAGIAAWRPGLDAHSLYREADLALLHAKRLGRNRIVMAPDADHDDTAVLVA